jgi:hypothetical protein
MYVDLRFDTMIMNLVGEILFLIKKMEIVKVVVTKLGQLINN